MKSSQKEQPPQGAASRTSPFASGPVAMVNQLRPGAINSNLPAVNSTNVARGGLVPGTSATPTQLSTPLVPRRSLAPFPAFPGEKDSINASSGSTTDGLDFETQVSVASASSSTSFPSTTPSLSPPQSESAPAPAFSMSLAASSSPDPFALFAAAPPAPTAASAADPSPLFGASPANDPFAQMMSAPSAAATTQSQAQSTSDPADPFASLGFNTFSTSMPSFDPTPSATDAVPQAPPRDLFGPSPPNSSSSSNDPFAAADSLFGGSNPFDGASTHTQTTQQTQRQPSTSAIDDLFGNAPLPDAPPRTPSYAPVKSPTPMLAPPGPMRSTASFSAYDPSTMAVNRVSSYSDDTSVGPTYRDRDTSAPPPPAAPFLGYTNNNARRSASVNENPVSTTASDPRVASFNTVQQQQHQRAVPKPPTPSASGVSITVPVRSVDELLEDFLHLNMASAPVVPACEELPDSIGCLEELYRKKRFKSLQKKAQAMLDNELLFDATNASNDTMRLEIKSWLIAALMKEGSYEQAVPLMDELGDLDELVVDDPSVTVRLRVLKALLSKYKGNLVDFEKKAIRLLLRSSQNGNDTESRRWYRILQLAMMNHLVEQSRFAAAFRLVAQTQKEGNAMAPREKLRLASRLGRTCLQMGNLRAAEKFFAIAKRQVDAMPDEDHAEDAVAARVRLNEGLLLFAKNSLQEALETFRAVLQMAQLFDHADIKEEDVEDAEEEEEDLLCAAVNNFAICSLYCCDVRSAVAYLEQMIQKNPERFLNSVIVFNLSSLYDLLYDNATSTTRKEMIKKLAELHAIEHVDANCFRI